MPDITMCSNFDCPKRKECYRYMAKADVFQSFSDFKNICNEETDYKMFWRLKNDK